MNVTFDKSFIRSVKKNADRALKERIEQLILEVETSDSINKIGNIKKLAGHKTYYRVRIGDFRVGMELQADGDVCFIIVCHRKEIYRYFP